MIELLLKGFFFIFAVLIFLLLIYPFARTQGKPDFETVQKVEYTSLGLRDPFRSPFEIEKIEEIKETEQPAKRLPQMQVQGMIWGSKMPQAIINNTVVIVGEVIDGAEILDISKEGIYVFFEGREYILKPHKSQK